MNKKIIVTTLLALVALTGQGGTDKPEASDGQHSNLSTIGFAVGFVLMMVLDVVLG